MKPARWQRIEKILQSALERAPAERAVFLDEACAGDESLRTEVESLLAADEGAGSFIEPGRFAPASDFADEKPVARKGQVIGHYRIISPLGKGGMGEVYLAQDTRLGRRLALKLLPIGFTRDQQRVIRFKQEARAASALNHPNIVTVYEIGQAESGYFIATEFIEGETLRQHLAVGQMSLDTILDVAIQIAGALAAAHTAGIVHRDIKPENIMLRPDGYVKVLDFGLAKLAEPRLPTTDSETTAIAWANTDPGTVMGTVSYMSPEQARGRTVDARTDVFSFGIVVYELITGHTPFEGETVSDVIAAILCKEPPPLSYRSAEVPDELERIVTRALSKDVDERYQATELLADLRDLRRSMGPGGLAGNRVSPWRRRHLRQASLVTIAIAIVVLVTSWYLLAHFLGPVERAINSIAVLPPASADDDPATEYLSDGIAESLINSLSQLSNLRVMSRDSVFRYKTRNPQAFPTDAQAVGRELHVRAVLTGRVVQLGDRLMIAMELIDVADGSQLWGARYSRKLADIFAMQEEIAREISEKLRLRLSGTEQKLLTKRYTENTEAYKLYLAGRYYSRKETEVGIKKAIEYYNHAIELDPGYALAYAGLADSYTTASNWLFPLGEAMLTAKKAATKALQLDETVSEAHVALGLVMTQYDWDWQDAEKEFKRAIELNPGNEASHHWYADFLMQMGRLDDAMAELKLAQELDPLSLFINNQLGLLFYYSRKYEQAIEQYRKTLDMESNNIAAHVLVGRAYVQNGKYEEAITEFKRASELDDGPDILADLGRCYAVSGKKVEAQKLLSKLNELSKHKYVSPYYFALIYIGLQQKDKAFEWLDRAYNERSSALIWLKVNPSLDVLRQDSRFLELVKRVGLEQ